LNVKSDWQLINFEIYLHLNWKVYSENVFRKFASSFFAISLRNSNAGDEKSR
jgi:hypothetical protein